MGTALFSILHFHSFLSFSFIKYRSCTAVRVCSNTVLDSSKVSTSLNINLFETNERPFRIRKKLTNKSSVAFSVLFYVSLLNPTNCFTIFIRWIERKRSKSKRKKDKKKERERENERATTTVATAESSNVLMNFLIDFHVRERWSRVRFCKLYPSSNRARRDEQRQREKESARANRCFDSNEIRFERLFYMKKKLLLSRAQSLRWFNKFIQTESREEKSRRRRKKSRKCQ